MVSRSTLTLISCVSSSENCTLCALTSVASLEADAVSPEHCRRVPRQPTAVDTQPIIRVSVMPYKIRTSVREDDLVTDTSSSEEDGGDEQDADISMSHVRALADLISYLCFLCFLFCIVFVNPAEYHGGKVVKGMQQSLSGVSVTSVDKLWAWLPLLAPSVQQQNYYNGVPLQNSTSQAYDAYFTREALALGRIRLRQQRLLDEDTCTLPEAFETRISECNAAAWVRGAMDSGDAGVKYVEASSEAANSSYCCLPRPFFSCKYEFNGDGYAWWSAKTKVLYPSAGYTVTLPLGEETASTIMVIPISKP